MLVVSLALAGPADAAGTASLTGAAYGGSPSNPLAGVTVTAFSSYYGVPLASAVTAANGSYTIAGLPAGKVRVRFEDPSGAWATRWNFGERSFATAPDVVLVAGSATVVNLSMLTTPSVAGLVVDDLGTPLAGIEVTLYAALFGAPMATTTTLGDGTYRFDGVRETPVSLWLEDPTGVHASRWHRAPWADSIAVSVGAGAVVSVPIATMTRQGSLTGTVTDAVGRPVVGATVATAGVADTVFGPAAATGADGRFHVDGLTPGPLDLVAADAATMADPTTGPWPTFVGDVPLVDETSRAAAPDVVVVPGSSVDVGTIHLTPRHCDPTVVHAGADLRAVPLDAVPLAGCYLPFARLDAASLPGADLTGTNLAAAVLAGADLTAAALVDAELLAADLSGVVLDGADLTGADLSHARLVGASLAGVTWSATTCPDGTDSDANGGTCLGHLGPLPTLVVDRTTDAADALPGDGACAVAGGGCTVRAALQEADATPGPDEVVLPAGTYPLSVGGPLEDAGATGDLDLSSEVALSGAGAVIVADGSGDRVLDVHAGAVVTLVGVTVAGGVAPAGTTPAVVGADGTLGESGGGIRNAGTLTLVDVVVVGSRAGAGGAGAAGDGTVPAGVGGAGGEGGGIASTGTLVVDGVAVLLDRAGDGGAPGGRGGDGGGIANHGSMQIGPGGLWVGGNRSGGGSTSGGVGPGGDGGGMVNGATGTITGATDQLVLDGNATGSGPGTATGVAGHGGGLANHGALTLVGTVITGNATGSTTVGAAGGGTGAGAGGGVHNDGTLTLDGASIAGNATGHGYGPGSASTGTGPGSGGDGGGVANAGSLTVVRTTISGNRTGTGGVDVTAGRGGDGGGIHTVGVLDLRDSTLSGNRTGDGGDGTDGFLTIWGWPGGRGGDGAGVHVGAGSATIRNVTISGGLLGDGGDGGDAGDCPAWWWPCNAGDGGAGGRSGAGGGVAVAGGDATVDFATITRNSTGHGGSGGAGGSSQTGSSGADGAQGATSTGAGIAATGGTVTVSASVVAAQTLGQDCQGSILSGGYNLDRTTSCGFTATGDLQSTSPALWALGAYGGPTSTHLPTTGSPVRDRIPVGAAGCGTTLVSDQRGVARPGGAACDVGAVEL